MKTLIVLFFLLVLMFSLSNVFASDYFCFSRLKNNETVPTTISSIGSNLICLNGKCTCHLSSGEGYCLVCLNSTGWQAAYNECHSDFCAVDPNANLSLSLNVNFPFDSYAITKNRFVISVNTSKLSKIDITNDLKHETDNLCMHCNSISKNFVFSEGLNKITIRATSLGETKEKTFDFLIDTKKPTIKNTFPIQGVYSNGSFGVSYDEDNIYKIELFYGLKDQIKSTVLKNCPGGKGKECKTLLDLSSYNGKKIDYFFTITDSSNKSVSSSKRSIFVDNKKPVIKSITYLADRNFIKVILNLSEDNFKSAMYFETNSSKGKLFCSSLRNGVCYRSFDSRYDFSGKLVITDKAGNTAEGAIKIV